MQAIVSEVDLATRTQAIIVSLDDHAWEQVTAGDTVRVNFAQKEKSSGFWVPTESLVAGPRGLWNCFVVENIKDGVGTAAIRTVELIHSDGDRSMISGPLQAGDVIVSAAPHRIIAGQMVRAVSAAESP